MAPVDLTARLYKDVILNVQLCVGLFLYYARVSDPTMLVTLNRIGSQQSKATQNTLDKYKMLMDYAATQPLSIIRYKASYMILHVVSDAVYLVQQNDRCQYAGHFYLSSSPPKLPTKPNPPRNGPILTVCKTICNVVASEAEAETGGLYSNAQDT